jgi:hypothetical protein
MDHFGAGHHLEHLAGEMAHRSDARRGHAEPAWISFRKRDEVVDRLGSNRWRDHHDIGRADDGSDGGDVAPEIERELVVERRIDRVRRAGQEQGAAIRGRVHDRLGGEVPAGARTVIDDKLLTESFRQRSSEQARNDVGRAAGGEPDNNAHRLRWIAVCPCET